MGIKEVQMYRVPVDMVEDHMIKWCENNTRYWCINNPHYFIDNNRSEAERMKTWRHREFLFDNEEDKIMFILYCL